MLSHKVKYEWMYEHQFEVLRQFPKFPCRNFLRGLGIVYIFDFDYAVSGVFYVT